MIGAELSKRVHMQQGCDMTRLPPFLEILVAGNCYRSIIASCAGVQVGSGSTARLDDGRV